MSVSRATAFYFGPSDRPLFGCLHVPVADHAFNAGIVICNPLGYDALCLHRTHRHLAAAAARRGLPVLRFDYDGTGDSAGADTDPERLSAWVASIACAARTLRERTGVDKVYLFGVRMGATLALLAAQDDASIIGVVAVNPVIDGRRYLRELRAMAVTSSQVVSTPDTGQDGIEDFSGLVTTLATREAVSAVKLAATSLQRAPRRVLIVERSDLPTDEALSQRLSTLGCETLRMPFPGYADMLRSAHESVVPDTDIEHWLDWIPPELHGKSVPVRGEPADDTTCRMQWPASSAARIEERIVWLDDEERTFCILTQPVADSQQPTRALLLLNAGAIHHIGPHRVYVRIARECALRGIKVLRLDLPGLGDSPVRNGHAENASYPDDLSAMIQPVLDYARRELGATEVDCAGVCSGAYHSLKVAAAGAALRAITVINPLTFYWKPHLPLSPPEFQDVSEVQRYRRTSLRSEAWIRLLTGKVNVARILGLLWRRWARKLRLALREVARVLRIGLKEDLATELRGIAGRGTRIHFIFADRDPGGQMLRDEGGRTVQVLARRGALDILTVPAADHTFTSWRAQKILVDRLVGTTSQRTERPP